MLLPFLQTRPLLVHILAAALICPVAMAKTRDERLRDERIRAATAVSPSQQSSPARKPTAATKRSARASAQPKAPDHRSLIADPAELLARVPSSGPLNEEHLILLAIANSPRLQAFRAKIADAVADRRSLQDLRNPELRLGYGSQDDDFVRDPYIDTTLKSDTLIGPTGPIGPYREIERIVTPHGTYEDSTVNEYFHTGIINPDDPLAPDRELISTGYERDTSTRINGGDQQFSALLRFQMPHPWQKKARLQRASAEVMIAEADYLEDEDKLVREVRGLAQDIGVLNSTLNSQKKRRQNFTSLRAEMEGAGLAEFAEDVFRARLEMDKVYDSMREVSSDIDRTSALLAKLCGLESTSRIRIGGIITRRVVDLATLDPAYLLEMAILYRADMVESRGHLEVAKAYVAEADAAKIPWASFIDAGWSQQRREAHSGTQEEWMVRLAFDFPLWEWTGINKRKKEYRNAAAAWELQWEKQLAVVRAEVNLALDRLRKSSASLREYESHVRRTQREVSEDLKKVDSAAAGLAGYAKGKRFKYDAEDGVQRNEITRYQAYADYNKALMGLEDAVGIRVERILNGWRDK